MKIQISFWVKKIKSAFNENTDQFLFFRKKIKSEKFRSVFELEKIISENTYQFFQFRKFRSEKFRLVFSLSLIKESQ